MWVLVDADEGFTVRATLTGRRSGGDRTQAPHVDGKVRIVDGPGLGGRPGVRGSGALSDLLQRR